MIVCIRKTYFLRHSILGGQFHLALLNTLSVFSCATRRTDYYNLTSNGALTILQQSLCKRHIFKSALAPAHADLSDNFSFSSVYCIILRPVKSFQKTNYMIFFVNIAAFVYRRFRTNLINKLKP